MEQEEIRHIIQLIQSGETNAFKQIIDTYQDFVFALCFKITGSREDAEEAASDTFVKAYKSLKTFKGNSKFSTWLYKIAYYTAINATRKKRIKTTVDYQYEPADERTSGFNDLQEKERSEYLNLALNQLKPNERALITLFYLDEQSMEEIATITGLSISNTKVKLHRTRKKLNGILNHILKNEVHSLM